MKKKVTLQFTVNSDDVRRLAGNATEHVLNRFKDDYVKAVNEVADSMTFDNGKEVLKKIKNLVLLCGKMEEELGDLVPLIQDIKDTHKRPEPQITRPLNLPPEA